MNIILRLHVYSILPRSIAACIDHHGIWDTCGGIEERKRKGEF